MLLQTLKTQHFRQKSEYSIKNFFGGSHHGLEQPQKIWSGSEQLISRRWLCWERIPLLRCCRETI